MKMPISKLKATLLYFCANTDPKFLGKVKLMKLFYFLDFGHLKKYGVPVTYDTYVNLEHGPIPSMIKNLVDEVCDDEDTSILADTVFCQHQEGSMIKRILPMRESTGEEQKLFSRSELEVLRLVCQRFGDKNTKYIEDASHNEAPWKMTEMLDTIPYSLALQDKDCQVSKEEIDFLEKAFSA